MGNSSTHNALGKAVHRAEDHAGRIQIEGRYHLARQVQDDYIIGKTVLGSGSSGCVMRGTNRQTGAKVAVKTLPLHHLSADKKAELLNETEVFLRMDHPHVARLYDVYETEESLIFVMEVMEGGELYDRVSEKRIFSESDAANATWQMLLAINYLHSEGIVHRDIKLENFLYERKGKDYLKLIDFGFSKVLLKNGPLDVSCGTISYVAPEVLDRNYGSQCDLWSMGVIVFVMLSGYMPFSGVSDEEIFTNIRAGRYVMKAKRWNEVSPLAINFVKSLLVVEPEYRLTAQAALEHAWITERHALPERSAIDESIATSLLSFAAQTRFRRACLQLMAWSLTRDERAEVRDAFLELDLHHTGVIKLTELKQVLEDKFHLPPDVCHTVVKAFQDMDHENDAEIHYSDFLAAMMSSRLELHDRLLKESFRHFDTENHGYITLANLHQVLGARPEVDDVFKFLDEDEDGKVALHELVDYLRRGRQDMAHEIIDQHLAETNQSPAEAHSPQGNQPRQDSKESEESDILAGEAPSRQLEAATAAVRRFGSGLKRKTRASMPSPERAALEGSGSTSPGSSRGARLKRFFSPPRIAAI
mmetsp:Transcript_21286/g.45500  ORF Transcript_21286/g.45500 Transcript_21286/m.45500 type:complete len:588 (-) Transcript_21286:696-2459(-)